MECKISHHDPDGLSIPEFLCRACHPELIHTPAADAVFYEALRKSQAREYEWLRLQREISSTSAKIEGIEARGRNKWGKAPIDPASVEGQIHAGLIRKLERLRNELAKHAAHA